MDIGRVFSKVASKELAYMYIIKKVAEMPIKKDRIKTATDLINYIQEEQNKQDKQLKNYKIYDRTCPVCLDTIDEETGLCTNCP